MLRRGIALAITAGSLVLTSSQPTATRVVAPRGGDGGPPQHSIYPATVQGALPHAGPVRLRAPRLPHQDQQRDDRGRPQAGRRRHPHGRPRRAARPARRRRRRASARSASSSPGTTRPRATTPPTRPARRRARSPNVTAVQAAADSGGTQQGHRHRPLHLHVQDGPAGRLRPDQDAHARRLRPAHDARRHHGRQGLHRQRRVRLPPDGAAVTEKWDEIQEKNACNQCHDPLAAHGDVRQDVKLCVLCHSPQTIRPRHRQHRGHEGHDPQDPQGREPAEREGGHAVPDHRQCPDRSRLLRRRLPAGHPQLPDLPRGEKPRREALAVGRLVHQAGPRSLRRLPRRHQLGDRREPPGRRRRPTTAPARAATSRRATRSTTPRSRARTRSRTGPRS